VAKAKELGYTEPDPREDLSGAARGRRQRLQGGAEGRLDSKLRAARPRACRRLQFAGALRLTRLPLSAPPPRLAVTSPRRHLARPSARAGMDVARKVVILARGCGVNAELSQLEVESLVPEALREGGADEFMQQLPKVGVRGGWAGQVGRQVAGRPVRYRLHSPVQARPSACS
jgi:hypothetical protein